MRSETKSRGVLPDQFKDVGIGRAAEISLGKLVMVVKLPDHLNVGDDLLVADLETGEARWVEPDSPCCVRGDVEFTDNFYRRRAAQVIVRMAERMEAYLAEQETGDGLASQASTHTVKKFYKTLLEDLKMADLDANRLYEMCQGDPDLEMYRPPTKEEAAKLSRDALLSKLQSAQSTIEQLQRAAREKLDS